MSIPFVRPPVSDLVFQLYGRPLHPEFFDILAMRRIEREDCEITLRITRTGHVFSWEDGKVHLTEVAAASGQGLPRNRRLLSCRLRGEHSSSRACSNAVTYQTSFQVEVLPPEIFVHVHDEILKDGGKRGMLYNFQPHHRLALAPLGFISVETRARCLFLTTFHTFPDEYTLVKSQSLIERQV